MCFTYFLFYDTLTYLRRYRTDRLTENDKTNDETTIYPFVYNTSIALLCCQVITLQSLIIFLIRSFHFG